MSTLLKKRIKVCGLTRSVDVSDAISLGADLLGFVLAPSPREINLDQLRALTAQLPATVLTVAVVVNPAKEFCEALLPLVDRIQFHGDESPEFCRAFGRRALKAVRVRSPQELDKLKPYENCVGGFLLDSFKEGQAGGTGHTFPWAYLQGRSFARPTLLAGGLKPSNVGEALEVEAVVGLDVSSGLESAPGVKDKSKMKEFFDTVNGRFECKP